MRKVKLCSLGLLLILALSACGGKEMMETTAANSAALTAVAETVVNETDKGEAVSEETETSIKDETSTEVSRAIAFGLVPEELQEDYEKTITYRQYCELLTNVIQACDEEHIEEWEKTISLAAESNQEMLREDGILATAYALVHMGKIEYSGANWDFFEEVQEYMNTFGYDLSWDYPLFPNWEETVFEWINCNYIQGGMTMCAIEKSHVSGQPIYPYDFEREGKHLKDELSREEAICAVLRLAETEDIFAENIPIPDDVNFREQ